MFTDVKKAASQVPRSGCSHFQTNLHVVVEVKNLEMTFQQTAFNLLSGYKIFVNQLNTLG